jgi:hypothetical protein
MWLDLGSRKLLRIARGFGLPKPLEGWLEDELPGAFLTEPRLDFRRSEPSRAASPKLILVGSPLVFFFIAAFPKVILVDSPLENFFGQLFLGEEFFSKKGWQFVRRRFFFAEFI